MSELVIVTCSVLSCILYFIVGVGVARMIADVNKRKIDLVDVCLWWMTCVYYAAQGESP